ncbi:MAG TPA: hypothetical protein VGG10_15125 [Rhizomicrobium sp.]|jgi:hypothetical protein
MSNCTRCASTEWVCENHPEKPWTKEGCTCGAGAPCPDCNPLAEVQICAVCNRPAITLRNEDDGSATPFCAEHIPDEEAREFADELRKKGWHPPGEQTH